MSRTRATREEERAALLCSIYNPEFLRKHIFWKLLSCVESIEKKNPLQRSKLSKYSDGIRKATPVSCEILRYTKSRVRTCGWVFPLHSRVHLATMLWERYCKDREMIYCLMRTSSSSNDGFVISFFCKQCRIDFVGFNFFPSALSFNIIDISPCWFYLTTNFSFISLHGGKQHVDTCIELTRVLTKLAWARRNIVRDFMALSFQSGKLKYWISSMCCSSLGIFRVSTSSKSKSFGSWDRAFEVLGLLSCYFSTLCDARISEREKAQDGMAVTAVILLHFRLIIVNDTL